MLQTLLGNEDLSNNQYQNLLICIRKIISSRGKEAFEEEKIKEKEFKIKNNQILQMKCKKCNNYCIGKTESTFKSGKKRIWTNHFCEIHYSEIKSRNSKKRIQKNEVKKKIKKIKKFGVVRSSFYSGILLFIKY